MRRIVISPYSKHRLDGKRNAKNYPYWENLVGLLLEKYDVLQIVYGDEPVIKPSPHSSYASESIQYVRDFSLPEIENEVKMADTFICVDNYLAHMAHLLGKRGVVLFGQSDPELFGYPENVNLYADRKYFRQWQFQTWHECEFDERAFVQPKVVFDAVEKLMLEISDPVKLPLMGEYGKFGDGQSQLVMNPGYKARTSPPEK